MDMFSHGLFPRRPGPEPQPPVVDNPFAPTLMATGFTGFAHVGGMMMITLENLQCDHSQQHPRVERIVIGRLALPVPAAQGLVAALNAFLEQQGCSPSKAAMRDGTMQ